jgi:hypothetical protein
MVKKRGDYLFIEACRYLRSSVQMVTNTKKHRERGSTAVCPDSVGAEAAAATPATTSYTIPYPPLEPPLSLPPSQGRSPLPHLTCHWPFLLAPRSPSAIQASIPFLTSPFLPLRPLRNIPFSLFLLLALLLTFTKICTLH